MKWKQVSYRETRGDRVEEDKKSTVRAAERALDILLCFINETQLGMMEIAERTQLNKSTVFRLLATLEGRGFVKRDPQTEKYQLGFSIWELATHLNRSDDPAILFLPEMEQLRDRLDETVSLYIRDGKERVRIQAVESKQTIRRVAPIGARLPLTAGASSKVLVAYESEAFQREVLADPRWPAGVEMGTYQERLTQVRESGYAISVQEREEGTSAVAVPVFNRSGKLIASLAVSGPISRMSVEQMEEYVPHLLRSAERMGKMVK